MLKTDSDLNIPLALDFDGTLHHGDLTALLIGWAIRRHPLLAFTILRAWLFYGRAAMKLVGAAHADGFSPTLDWDERVVVWALEEHAKGRDVVVVTGSAQAMARKALRDKGLPFKAIGTVSDRLNMVAGNKADWLVAQYGERGFDYAGNSRDDLKVWPRARHAIVANAPTFVENAAKELGNVVKVFPTAK